MLFIREILFELTKLSNKEILLKWTYVEWCDIQLGWLLFRTSSVQVWNKDPSALPPRHVWVSFPVKRENKTHGFVQLSFGRASWARDTSERGKTKHEAVEHSANEKSEKRAWAWFRGGTDRCGHMDKQAGTKWTKRASWSLTSSMWNNGPHGTQPIFRGRDTEMLQNLSE